MRNKKFKLTRETIEVNGVTLHRIKALKDFAGVKKGDLGGFVEKEENLSHVGNCWIYGDAKVYEYASVFGNSCISGVSQIHGYATIRDNATIYAKADIFGTAHVCDNVRIGGNAIVYDNSYIIDNAHILGDTIVHSNMHIIGDVVIENSEQLLFISHCGKSNNFYTCYLCDDVIRVNGGTFEGTINEFRDRVKETYKNDNAYIDEYLALTDFIELRFRNSKKLIEMKKYIDSFKHL